MVAPKSKSTKSSSRRPKPGERRTPRDASFEVLSSTGAWDIFSIMLYGQPGIGKTWLAGTSIQHKDLSPVLLIDADGGSKTVRGKKRFEGIDIIRVYQFEAFNEIYAMLEKASKYKTVIIDNLGMVHSMAMDLEMEKVCRDDPAREPHVPSRREYGIVRAQIHKLVRFFTELGVNLVVTAHAELDKDEVTGLTRIRPAIAGKLAYEIPGLVDVVGYLETERPEKGGGRRKNDDVIRVARFQPYRRVDAKDESDNLGVTMQDPTMPKIAKLCGVVK